MASEQGTVAGVAQRARLHVMTYGPDRFEEAAPESLAEAGMRPGALPVTWINVNSCTDRAALEELERLFGLHPLALEDVRNPRQRPKTEDYGDYLYVVTRMPQLEEDEVRSEQLSLFLGKGWVITVQEAPGDVFEGVRDRIRTGRSRLRSSGADYLAYALLDAIVDSYFPLLEGIGNRLEKLEDEATDPATGGDFSRTIVAAKRQLVLLRRLAWPQREAIAFLERGDHPVLTRASRPFFRDVYDHTVRIIDVVEVYRELASDIQDLHLSSVNTRMNEIMKVLTIMATIFIPLTFITGIYGMNFDTSVSPFNMPELQWAFGYPTVLLVMLAVASSLLVFFRRKGWI